jgi:hypothetical protein
MSWRLKLEEEVKSVAWAALYFATWIGTLIVLKELVLAEYRIAFYGLSMAVVGALVLAKVVLVLEHVPLGEWIRTRPALVDVILRTILYALGLVVVLLLEKGFEGRHEYGGFVPSLMAVFQHTDIHHVWANAICLSGALLGYTTCWPLSVATLAKEDCSGCYRHPSPRNRGKPRRNAVRGFRVETNK